MHVYADNAATTKMSPVAINAMLPYFDKIYGNPSSLHSVGQEAREALDAARDTVAACLGCESREIIFTSGGSEADNQAIISAARIGARKNKKHIITTAFEHHAVLHTLNKLEKEGFEVTYLDVRKGHNITAQQVADAIREAASLHITNVMDIKAVNVVEPANYPEEKAKPHVLQWTLIGGLLGVLLVCAIVPATSSGRLKNL